MIEKLVNSKTRLKILKFFLSHIEDRYYLRELERLLDESLSPLRRQLLKLTGMGILITEEEANLKYYSLNKNFEGLEELKRIVLDNGAEIPLVIARSPEGAAKQSQKEIASLTSFARNDNCQTASVVRSVTPKQFRYDLAILSFISIFVLITAIFMVYANTKNIRRVTDLISEARPQAAIARKTDVSSGEMMSRKWKLMPGNVPVLSTGETGGEKKSKEL